ncbi:hypothetical protein [Nitrosopumilus ureiphilus]|uniref:Uncharacterized protein n=1 Tax=Nitrosopumilus ureiphilus TaxID=1470067 RepID=A0A7D5REZ5_9ARCH|nr:hypothetical protein [Nitrosopumilus ureiphilus]QLH07423.1 hypothetical protein C5F50_10350 [Nitrosopumilus ureiphilus]
MTTYPENFMKDVMGFSKTLSNENWQKMLNGMNNDEAISKIQYYLIDVQTAIKILYVVIENEMKETNRIRVLLDKLPDTKEFEAVKHELAQQRKESIETLLPIKKLSEALEESKNRKVDYIG